MDNEEAKDRYKTIIYYHQLPKEIRDRVEEDLSKIDGLSFWQRRDIRHQITELYFKAAVNPSPYRLRCMIYRLRFGIFYQKVCDRLDDYYENYKRACRYIFGPFRNKQ